MKNLQAFTSIFFFILAVIFTVLFFDYQNIPLFFAAVYSFMLSIIPFLFVEDHKLLKN